MAFIACFLTLLTHELQRDMLRAISYPNWPYATPQLLGAGAVAVKVNRFAGFFGLHLANAQVDSAR
jgi:hypothetical protein